MCGALKGKWMKAFSRRSRDIKRMPACIRISVCLGVKVPAATALLRGFSAVVCGEKRLWLWLRRWQLQRCVPTVCRCCAEADFSLRRAADNTAANRRGGSVCGGGGERVVAYEGERWWIGRATAEIRRRRGRVWIHICASVSRGEGTKSDPGLLDKQWQLKVFSYTLWNRVLDETMSINLSL